MKNNALIRELEREWATSPRWQGILRPYTAEKVEQLRGTIGVDYTLAKRTSAKLWDVLHDTAHVSVLSAVTGNQAIQEVRAGLKAIYCSGWQVAADANDAAQMYPDLSLYPCDSAPELVRRINNALIRADQVHHAKGDDSTDWLAPIVADAEAGFGGPLHCFEIMKAMIAAGAAGVHFEDQLASVKKCGHLGGKVLVPSSEFITKLIAARLAADVCGVDTLLIARTDAGSATMLTSNIDPHDRLRCTGERTSEGFYVIQGGLDEAIARGKLYAPYADLLWFETSKPDLDEARAFANEIHAQFPGKLLAYNCSPSFNWKRALDDTTIENFQHELGCMGYKFQFVTLSGFHSLNHAMFRLARDYKRRGMGAYADLQSAEFEAEKLGYEAVRHQEFVGTGYFDEVTQTVMNGTSSTTAMAKSTEADQFQKAVI